MRHGFDVRQRLDTTLRVDPRIVLSSQVLQMTQPELEQAVESELNENPALERLAHDLEPVTDEAILRVVAPQELAPTSEDFEFHRSLPAESAPDWTEMASALPSLWDHLRAQLIPYLPPKLQPVGEFMIGCVSEKGYLGAPLEEIALDTRCSLEEAEIVLRALQNCEPAGVGATNLQECLLLQLRKVDTYEQKLARAILREHLDDFIARRVDRISRRYRVVPDVVQAAFREILALSPFPGEEFGGPAPSARSRSTGILPDLVFGYSEAGWTVEVRGLDPNNLAVNRAYQRRLRQLNDDRHACRDEKRHLETYVARAGDFIASVQQRRQTLRAVGEYLLQRQTGFIATGRYQFLTALTRSRLARDLGIHESTVSRATQGKFVQIPNGDVLPFEVFFKPALRVQKMIEEILQSENPNNPLSDEAIAALLAKKGVVVARRTVNKYRDRTRLLSSRKRRSA